MNFAARKHILIAVGIALSGCSGGSLLDSKANVPQANNIQVGNNLAMPPDLQLAVPGPTSENYQSNGDVAPIAPTGKPTKQLASAQPIVPIVPKQDLYTQYGISKTNPDGSPKERSIYEAELKAAILKKKQQTNPGYGTITNIGAIFSDQ